MKSLKRNIVHSIAFLSLMVCCMSCELFGLDYQYNYENERAPLQTELGVSCFEFIKGRSMDDMSLFYEAIVKAELQSLYETEGHTYFLLKDDQVSVWLTSYRYPSIKDVPKAVLQEFLLSYTIKGQYHSSGLSSIPVDYPALDGKKTIRMRLYPSPSTSSQNLNQIQANYVPAKGDIGYRNVITSNLKGTNGIMHILQYRFS